MAKRKSDLSKIIDFFMAANEPEARAALDSAKTVVANRFDGGAAKAARKPGSGKRKAAAAGEAGGTSAANQQ